MHMYGREGWYYIGNIWYANKELQITIEHQLVYKWFPSN